MVRAVAADVTARARIAQGLIGPAGLPALHSYSKLEPWVRRAVPAMIVLFIAVLTSLSILLINEAHDRAIEDAITDLDLVASDVTDEFNAALDRGDFNPAPDPYRLGEPARFRHRARILSRPRHSARFAGA